ncbi:ATP-binding cassette domain-containing protein [Oscillibacter valericigenes]|uniref:ATP-binding cassette domain-containing protein n=1 Tax=Oscillibacter valericigenes TaxID=351091 RepID=A0ABS2FSY4_9FIRM|nr:ATP-binding cassette domain-containing protein [Oscillibacter valericigenes]MBM6850684.1 ATP-binding cassette domain-containing protein [Oscillibacter valericigenes]
MAEPIIRFEGVSKSYGGQPALKNFSLDVLPGELLTIIGRSGCGKTTALKLVNSLITPDAGRVLVQGEDVAKTDPVALRRRIGYAIQSVGLFPHMTVEKNIAYVPAISHLEGWKGPARRERVSALLRQVGLDPALADRYPRALSGGQRQRVGIARALAAGPEILLMDEPFGAVDEITRGQLQEEILRIHRESGITILFVTHDIAEALKLGTHTLVIDKGTVQQCAQPEEILRHPATDFVRELVEPQRRRDSILQRRRLPL